MSPLIPTWAVAVVVVVALSACAVARPIILNVHEVVPGEVLRSAQLAPHRLAALIERHKIRSVLNLRGPSTGVEWYDDERAVCSKAAVEHIDFELWSAKEVTTQEAAALIELMKRAPKPMLIHCWAGADRTGFAAALYLYAIQNEEAEKAGRALSIRYLHLPFTSAGAMDRSFRSFVSSDSRQPSHILVE